MKCFKRQERRKAIIARQNIFVGLFSLPSPCEIMELILQCSDALFRLQAKSWHRHSLWHPTKSVMEVHKNGWADSPDSGFDTVIVCRILGDTLNPVLVAMESRLRCICRNPIGIAFQTTIQMWLGSAFHVGFFLLLSLLFFTVWTF